MSTFTLARALRPKHFIAATLLEPVAGKSFHWACSEKMLNEILALPENTSPLLRLLIRYRYTEEGLSTEECAEAKRLIETEPEAHEYCRNEITRCTQKAIGDTGLCRDHNRLILKNGSLA